MNPEYSRLFFAIFPDKSLRQSIEDYQNAILPVDKVKPVPGNNLHMTLVFLGQFPEARIGELKNSVGNIDCQPFCITLNDAGWWRRSALAWISPRSIPPELIQLVSDLQQVCEPFGFQPSTRPFKPHVTLARKVKARGITREPDPLFWSVGEFALIRSHTLPAGSHYEKIGIWRTDGRYRNIQGFLPD